MGPDLTVITRYVIRNAALCFTEMTVSGVWYPFRFKATEEALHRAVIPAVTPSTQTLFNLISP